MQTTKTGLDLEIVGWYLPAGYACPMGWATTVPDVLWQKEQPTHGGVTWYPLYKNSTDPFAIGKNASLHSEP